MDRAGESTVATNETVWIVGWFGSAWSKGVVFCWRGSEDVFWNGFYNVL